MFLAIWFVTQLLFIYLPFSFQRKFIEGMFWPIAIFTVLAIDYFAKKVNIWLTVNYFYLASFIYLSIGVIANFFLLFLWLPNNYVYRKTEEKEAANFLDAKAKRNQIALSLPATGVIMANLADLHLFVGQGQQTPNFEDKKRLVNSYFGGEMNDRKGESFVYSEDICFVYVGPEEKKIAKVDFAKEGYLEKFYSNDFVEIYKTKWCR